MIRKFADPFVMYIVDVNKPAGGIDAPPPPPPQPDYPSPPPNAIPFTNNGSQIPIFYNQTVVLQCLTSGVVSPVLIIRKVDQYHHLTPKVTFLRANKVLMTTTNLRGLHHSPICPALSRGLPVAHRTKSLSLTKQRRLWKRHRRTTSSSSF